LRERLEQLFALLLAHADAGVADGDRHEADGPSPLPSSLDGDLSLLGELAGIGEKVEQDLPRLGQIGINSADIAPDDVEGVALLVGERLHRARDLVDQQSEVERLHVQIDLARFDLREIEHTVDELEQVLGGRFDLLDIGCQLRDAPVGQLFFEQLGVEDDGVQRCAQLVAHAGQKGALGVARPLGRFPRAPFLIPRRLQLADLLHEALALVLGQCAHCDGTPPVGMEEAFGAMRDPESLPIVNGRGGR